MRNSRSWIVVFTLIPCLLITPVFAEAFQNPPVTVPDTVLQARFQLEGVNAPLEFMRFQIDHVWHACQNIRWIDHERKLEIAAGGIALVAFIAKMQNVQATLIAAAMGLVWGFARAREPGQDDHHKDPLLDQTHEAFTSLFGIYAKAEKVHSDPEQFVLLVKRALAHAEMFNKREVLRMFRDFLAPLTVMSNRSGIDNMKTLNEYKIRAGIALLFLSVWPKNRHIPLLNRGGVSEVDWRRIYDWGIAHLRRSA